jgi:hypothetical protein
MLRVRFFTENRTITFRAVKTRASAVRSNGAIFGNDVEAVGIEGIPVSL